jgi:ubiquinone/menaquinone biosynthesis C-methylase UbiE
MSAKTIAYFDKTANTYDDLHGDERVYIRALEVSWPFIETLAPQSLLDVGCGTGRTLRWVANVSPNVKLFGIDPSINLLERAKFSTPDATLKVGSGEHLEFPDRSIDLVAASAIMHYVDHPSTVISEMFRVAKKAVIISDHNNFAFGSKKAQRIRILLYCLGLLGVATFIKQGFKKQGYTEHEGWWYPYSLLNNFAQISALSDIVHLIPTGRATAGLGGNILFSQSHFVILAMKNGAVT